MSLREIVCWPDPVLEARCAPIPEITDETRRLARDMLETMYAAPGRGLAAPQVGVLSRLFVMDTEWRSADPAPMIFVNPELVGASDRKLRQPEGCLSIPGVTAEIERPAEVEVRWVDIDGVTQQRVFDGFAAACVQHEMDHLDGVLTLDHLSPEDRAALMKDYKGAMA